MKVFRIGLAPGASEREFLLQLAKSVNKFQWEKQDDKEVLLIVEDDLFQTTLAVLEQLSQRGHLDYFLERKIESPNDIHFADPLELVRAIGDSPHVVENCESCKTTWLGVRGAYELWYKAPGDGMAQVLVEIALCTYLDHRNTHSEVSV